MNWYNFQESLKDLRRRIWNKRLKLWWYRLWVRRNEFHKSLETDMEAMLAMDEDELASYYADLQRRRVIAHKRSFAK